MNIRNLVDGEVETRIRRPNEADSDGESDGDEGNYQTFMDAIKSMGSKKQQKKKKKSQTVQRSESSTVVSELHETKAHGEAVSLEDLMSSLQDTKQHTSIKKHLTTITKSKKKLPPPVPEFKAAKAKRQVAYSETKQKLQKWQGVVENFRSSDHIKFPLKQPSVRFPTTLSMVKKFKPLSQLEAEISELLQGSEHHREAGEELSPAELAALEAMDLEEALVRRQELARLRARQSYFTARARWQKKIKSKKYHNLLKRERVRKQAAEAEGLVKSNPEAAAEKLQHLEDLRVLERMTQRHRNTSKWAKYQIAHSKGNKKGGEALQEQLDLGRELTRKLQAPNDDSDEEQRQHVERQKKVTLMKQTVPMAVFPGTETNPWMKTSQEVPTLKDKNVSKDGDASVATYRKYWKTVESYKEAEDVENKVGENSDESEIKRRRGRKTREEEVSGEGADQVEKENKMRERRTGKKNKEAGKKGSETVVVKSILKRSAKEKKLDRYLERKSAGVNGDSENGNAKVESKRVRKNKGDKLKQGKKNNSFEIMENGEADVLSATEFVDNLFTDLDNVKFKKVKKDLKKGNNKSNDDDETDESDTDSERETELRDRKRRGGKAGIDNEDEVLPFKVNKTPMMHETTKRKRTLEDYSNMADTEHEQVFEPDLTSSSSQPIRKKQQHGGEGHVEGQGTGEPDEVEVNPRDFISVEEKVVRSRGAGRVVSSGDTLLGEDSDDSDDVTDVVSKYKMTIAEAFAEDDVLAEFQAEKEQQVTDDKPRDIDLVLPGWGSWGGETIPIPEHKKQKFVIKAPTGPARKDQKLGHVIIRERKNKKVASHQVRELPWEFLSVPEFENSIRAPVGKHWNPETAFSRLVEPRVVTKMGTVIEPMDADALVTKMKPAMQRRLEGERNHVAAGRGNSKKSTGGRGSSKKPRADSGKSKKVTFEDQKMRE